MLHNKRGWEKEAGISEEDEHFRDTKGAKLEKSWDPFLHLSHLYFYGAPESSDNGEAR